MAHVRFGEVIEPQSGNHVEVFRWVPVELSESVGRVHRVITVIFKLVRHQVISQVIRSDGQRVFIVERVVVKGAYAVLHVAVVADVILVRYQIVTLVVLVECIGNFQVALGI